MMELDVRGSSLKFMELQWVGMLTTMNVSFIQFLTA